MYTVWNTQGGLYVGNWSNKPLNSSHYRHHCLGPLELAHLDVHCTLDNNRQVHWDRWQIGNKFEWVDQFYPHSKWFLELVRGVYVMYHFVGFSMDFHFFSMYYRGRSILVQTYPKIPTRCRLSDIKKQNWKFEFNVKNLVKMKGFLRYVA